MINFFVSLDNGLLENEINNFKRKNDNVLLCKNSTINDLHINLLQRNLFFSYTNYIFENFQNSLSEIEKFFKEYSHQKQNILITKNDKKPAKFTIFFSQLISNKKIFLSKLNFKNQMPYIDNAIKNLNIKISPQNLEVIKKNLWKSFEEINVFFHNLNLLSLFSKKVDISKINYLFSCWNEEDDFYDFFYIYFLNPTKSWIQLLNKKTKKKENIMPFIKIIIFQLFNIFNYFELRQKYDIFKIAEIKQKPVFIFLKYEEIYKKFGCSLITIISEFIFNLYIFINKKFLDKNINSSYIKYFFLKNSPVF